MLHFGEINGTHVEQVKGMTYSLDALLGVAGQNVNKTIDQIDYEEGSRKGKVVDGAFSRGSGWAATIG